MENSCDLCGYEAEDTEELRNHLMNHREEAEADASIAQDQIANL